MSLLKIRNSCLSRYVSIALVYCILLQLCGPLYLYANNASSTENQIHISAENQDMVNLFTGDFNYTIPLLEVEGYPINLTYSGNVSMNDEASWVGLGWNCTPGSINRQIKGIPDDFKGDQLKEKLVNKPYAGVGIGGGKGRFKSFFFNSGGMELENGISVSTFGLSKYTSLSTDKTNGLFKGKSYSRKYSFDSKWGSNVFVSESSWATRLKNPIKIETNTKESYSTFSSRSGSTYQQAVGKNTQYNSWLISMLLGIVSGVPIPVFSSTKISLSKTPLSYGTSTYTPSLLNSSYTLNKSYKKANGLYAIFWTNYSFFRNTAGVSTVLKKVKDTPSYGYIFLEHSGENSITDFNKVQEDNFLPNQNLNPNVLTYDVFSASADGISIDFRAHRNDIGSVASARQTDFGVGFSEEVLKLKTQKKYSTSIDLNVKESKPWNNNSQQATNFFRYTGDIPFYEKVYFKDASELTNNNQNFYDQFGGDKPAAVKLNNGFLLTAEKTLKVGSHTETNVTTSSLPTTNFNENRVPRNTLIEFLNAKEATLFATNSTITDYYSYSGSDGTKSIRSQINRDSYPEHHLSEVSILNETGNRYVYGLPVYNTLQKEVSFSTDATPSDCTKPYITYLNGENTEQNTSGYNNMYYSKEVPAHTTGYLLTSVLSDDYIDVSNNGPSEDDMGSYTKFNYSREYNDLKWRLPIEENKAYYNENSKGLTDDNTASYTYGTKDVWYLHSVETKNFIAEFYLENRVDAYAVTGENGGINQSSPLKRLKKIELYNKNDRIKNGADAVPVKTVHFEYDYSLCPNYAGNSGVSLPNNENDAKGKLTLKRVYFTYGNSKKGQLSAYSFQYSNINPDYNPFATDRWGTYRPNSCSLPNTEYSYSSQQNKTQSDQYASAYHLTDILTPEGSKISVSYESDDYAFVEDKQAGQMFKIIGTDDFPDDNFSEPSEGSLAALYQNSGSHQLNPIIYFKLHEPLTAGSKSIAKDYLSDNYQLHKGKRIYFNILSKLGLNNVEKENINGYVEVDDYGVIGSSGPYTIGWIKAANYPGTQVGAVNPFIYYSLQYLWAKNTRMLWEGSLNAGGALDIFLTSHVYDQISIKEIKDLLLAYLLSKGAAKYLHTHQSMIRLSNPVKKKLGGGTRVNKIQVFDNWQEMGGNYNYTYEQVYDYTMLENEVEISSGIAQQEPPNGNDESSLITPLTKKLERINLNYPNEYFDQEAPANQSLYNAPLVGYRSVKVKTNVNATPYTKHANGYSIFKFFTAYDFPSYLDYTENYINYMPIKKENFAFLENYGVSQGFVFHRNNMHGKMRSVEKFNEAGSLVEGMEVYYKTDEDNSKKLIHEVSLLNPDGTFSQGELGKSTEAFHNAEISFADDGTVGLAKTVTLLTSYSSGIFAESTNKRFYSSNFTKIIDHNGIVDRVEYFSQGAKAAVKNIGYDAETGNVLVSTVEDEYRKYNTLSSLPASWTYEGMAPAYRNYRTQTYDFTILGNTYSLITWNGNGTFTLTLPNNKVPSDYFMVGDQLLVIEHNTSSDLYSKVWIAEIDDQNEQITCIDETGSLYAVTGTPNKYTLRVLRTARKNMQGYKVAQTTSLRNAETDNDFLTQKIINTNAVEFSDNWGTECAQVTETCKSSLKFTALTHTFEGEILDNSSECGDLPDDVINPYKKGLRGIWRPKNYWSYHALRKTTTEDYPNPLLREDGIFEQYAPFWEYHTNSGLLITIKNPNHSAYSTANDLWRKEGSIDEISPFGYIRQVSDILNRSSAALYSYNPVLQNMPVGVTLNARITDIANDNFEDYAYLNEAVSCQLPGHFSFKNMEIENDIANFIDNSQSHTGKYSLRIPENNYHSAARVIHIDPCAEVSQTGATYEMQECDCHRYFSPEIEKSYMLSVWVKEKHTGYVETYDKAQAEIIFLDAQGSEIAGPAPFKASGVIIEGWQKIEEIFEVPENARCIVVKFSNTEENAPEYAWFDDLRIHPEKATMRTMVYDPHSLRMAAELDENNYATFYQYNNEGILVRMNKETENGIKTAAEIRKSFVKENE